MQLKHITDQSCWDGFLSSQPYASFPQSWTWGEFQVSLGKQVRRYHLCDEDRVVCAVQLMQEKRRFSGYWFAPRGPIFAEHTNEHLRTIFEELLTSLLEERLGKGSLFLRFEPVIRLEKSEGMMPVRMRRNHSMNPAATRILSLKKTEDELLAEMHQKTRYNIRLSAKHAVTIRESTDEKDLQAFLRLTQETAERDKFQAHSLSYLEKSFRFLSKAGMAKLRLAEHEGDILAANMEIWFGDTVTYLHGASSSQKRNLMAPYLLQWEAIRAAKTQASAQYYDFWGCNPANPSSYYFKKSWEGISRFKSGFGGELIHLVGTWDLPINQLLYHMVYREQWFRY